MESANRTRLSLKRVFFATGFCGKSKSYGGQSGPGTLSQVEKCQLFLLTWGFFCNWLQLVEPTGSPVTRVSHEPLPKKNATSFYCWGVSFAAGWTSSSSSAQSKTGPSSHYWEGISFATGWTTTSSSDQSEAGTARGPRSPHECTLCTICKGTHV